MSNIRYTFGGDEHLVGEVSEEMSLEAFFRSIAICDELRNMEVAGVTEICPANASFLVRFDPDVIAPDKVQQTVQDIEQKTEDAPQEMDTRIIEIPVFYNDPWTHETLMRFRDRHQDSDATDLEYGARINGYDSVEDFIEAHHSSPWFVSMVGFVAGLPFSYQMVDRSKQIQVPKYVRPRTDTPKQTVGHGGCFGAFYSVRGAGGYQMFGISPATIFDPRPAGQRLPYLNDFMCFFRPGDIIKWKPITREEYDRDVAAVNDGTFDLNIKPVHFSLEEYNSGPEATKLQLSEVLHD